jgi:hypothetical protein
MISFIIIKGYAKHLQLPDDWKLYESSFDNRSLKETQKASKLRRNYIHLKVYHVYLKGRNMMKCGPKPMKLLRNSGEIKTIIDIVKELPEGIENNEVEDRP